MTFESIFCWSALVCGVAVMVALAISFIAFIAKESVEHWRRR